jgi:hypothetical protein
VPLDYCTIWKLSRWTILLLNFWTIGILDYWTIVVGHLRIRTHWTTIPLDFWTTGLLDHRNTGCLDLTIWHMDLCHTIQQLDQGIAGAYTVKKPLKIPRGQRWGRTKRLGSRKVRHQPHSVLRPVIQIGIRHGFSLQCRVTGPLHLNNCAVDIFI